MSNYKYGDWYCKPANESEAREIIERAVASGAVNPTGWIGDSWDYCRYGVADGQVYPYSKDETSNATKYTINQVRDLFPLLGEKVNAEWNGKGSPPVGWHGECSSDKYGWFECVVLPSGFIAYTTDGKWWNVDRCDGLEFRPLRTEREQWVEDTAVFAHKDAVLTPEQAKHAAYAIYDAFKSGDLKAPEVGK